jgi:D-alanyl-D-alanine carboxypeptidase
MLARARGRKDIGAEGSPWGSHRTRSPYRTTHQLGIVLALALLATACGSPSGSPLAPGASAEKPVSVAASRPAVPLDPAPEQAEPGGPFLPAGGSDPAAESTAGFQPASRVGLEEPPPARGAWPLAHAADAAESAPSTAAVYTAELTAPAPRRVSAAAAPAVSARYVAVLDEASGELLHGQDEHARVAPASVTKIATTLVALEREPDLDQRVPVAISGSAMAARDHSSIMGLEPGRQVSLKTLLYGMMLPSGNDAAEQVALALGGSRENYVAWMNQKVTELGLQDTHFVTPSGMDADGHYSSAYDMAWLGRVAMQNETFRQLAGAASYRGDGYTMTNLNRLIGVYPGADGIKIGLTRAAGRTIVASASRDGHRVYVSLLRSQDLPGDSILLFDWVWRTFAW